MSTPAAPSTRKGADGYLASLLSYSLETLDREPSVLDSQEEALQQELQDTATRNYQGFIEAASCFHQIRGQVQDVKAQLKGLGESLQGLHSQTTEFVATAQEYQVRKRALGSLSLVQLLQSLPGAAKSNGFCMVSEARECVISSGHELHGAGNWTRYMQGKHNRNRNLVAQRPAMLELLETPQLIDTCVRTNNYDEALDLIAFANKVAVVAPDVPVVTKLTAEVAACQQALLEQLLSKLSGNVSLPECLRCVSYLRRLPVFTEGELRLRFLQCREQWLQSVISALDESNTAEYLRQLTDAYRLHLFDIVMQFRAIFSADAAGSDASNGAVPAIEQAAPVLFSWAHHRVQFYVDQMQELLPSVPDGAALTAVLEAAAYAGRSLARVGLDISALLAYATSAAVRALLQRQLALAAAMFFAAVDSHRWVVMPVAAGKAQPEAASGGGIGADGGAAVLEAAQGLLSHPPLAVLVNAFINAFNTIRGIALVSLHSVAADETQAVLHECCTLLLNAPVSRKLSQAERTAHLEACRAMVGTVCPLVAQLFRQVFSTSENAALDIAQCTGSLQDFIAAATPAPAKSASAAPSARHARTASAASTQASPAPRAADRLPAASAQALPAHAPKQQDSAASESVATAQPSSAAPPAAPPPQPAPAASQQESEQQASSPKKHATPGQAGGQATAAAGAQEAVAGGGSAAGAGFGGFGADDDSNDGSYTEDAW